MKYKCVFPNCNYETDNRSLIEYHHVYPRELKVTLNKNVTVPLCSCHHKMIYHPDATSGQHSVKHSDSMIIDGVYNTNTGLGIQFSDMQGHTYTTYIDTKQAMAGTTQVLSWSIIDGIKESRVPSDTLSDLELRSIDRYGYYSSGLTIYYRAGYKHVAADMLAMSVTNMMTQVKSEYNQLLEKARSDWKSLKEMDD